MRDPVTFKLVKPAGGNGGLAQKMRRFLVPPPAVTLFYLWRDRASVSMRAEVELSPLLKFGPGCTVSSFTKIKATHGPLVIGARSGFGTGCFLSSGRAGIEIGDDVLCGPNVTILSQNYIHDELEVPFEQQGQSSKGVKIGNNVWVGAGCVIADGAEIGDNSIVVAGSLVTRRHPSNVIIQGSPAKVILKRGRTTSGSNEDAGPSPDDRQIGRQRA